jgi:UDP-N-acetylmuramate dehydrogenase
VAIETSVRERLLELPFVSTNEPLSKHTTMKVGGPAALWAEPNTEAELAEVLGRIHQLGVPLFVLGAGSNMVASDAGYDGVVLHLGKGFEWRRAEENLLIAGGAMLLPKLTHFAIENCLGNFEWACGIPGSIGGSLWGNAGARGFNGQNFEGRDCAADFHSCVAYDRQGRRYELKRGEVEFAYRKSSLGELIVTEAAFALKPLSELEAARHKEAVRELLDIRRRTQPANAASAGCIWKNPKVEGCLGAGALVEQLGLKGTACGKARVSEIHANFVINAGGATATEVRELIRHVEDEVRESTGIELEREARYLG